MTIADGNVVTVKGPKGTLTQHLPSRHDPEDRGQRADRVTRPDDEHLHKSLHGLTRTLIHNMVEGVDRRASPRSWKSTALATVPRRRAISWS